MAQRNAPWNSHASTVPQATQAPLMDSTSLDQLVAACSSINSPSLVAALAPPIGAGTDAQRHPVCPPSGPVEAARAALQQQHLSTQQLAALEIELSSALQARRL